MGRNVLIINQVELRRALQLYLNSGILSYPEKGTVVNVTMSRDQQRCTIIFDPYPQEQKEKSSK